MDDNKKVMFSRSVDIVPIRKGIYKNAMHDTVSFALQISKTGTDVVSTGNGLMPAKLVFGYANVSVQEDGSLPFDWQGDAIDTDVLEMAAYNYVLQGGIANQEHMYDTDCGYLVESIAFTKEKMQALGIPEGLVPEGWWVGFYIPDPDVYAKVLDGTYNMFSIEGKADRISI